MEFTFLGTSSGVPTRQRNLSALALRGPRAKGWYLVDCGEGTQQQLLKTPYSLQRLQGIFITHVHGDHCFGLPGLLASTGMAGRREPLTLVGPRKLKRFIDAALELSESYLPYPLEFVPVESLSCWDGPDVQVEKWELSHRVPSFAYSFSEREIERKLDKEKLQVQGIESGPAWGALLRGEVVQAPSGELLEPQHFLHAPRRARRMVVGGDNDDPWLLEGACVGADVLIHESTYTRPVFERVGAGRQHSYAGAVARFAAAMQVPNLFLTHFSSRYQYGQQQPENSLAELEREAREEYQGNLFLADDLASYRLEKDGGISAVINKR